MTEQDLVQRFSSANPITDDDAEAALTADQWKEMFVGIVSHEMPPRRQAASRPPWKSMRVAAVIAGVLAIAVVVPTLWIDGPSGASPAAADALHRAADAARSQRALPAPGPGQYLYFRTEERSTSMFVPGHGQTNFLFTESMDIEAWTSQDGSGRVVTEPTGITFPTSADRTAWENAGKPELKSNKTDDRDPAGEQYTIDLSEVPTDPDELLEAIERRELIGGDGADWVTFQIISELLHLAYSSPEHRAALYEVAANFPGVDSQGPVTDPAGREGVSVSYDGGGQRREMIFDPETAELLAERQILLDQAEAGVAVGPDTWPGTIIAFAGRPGTVVYWNTYLQTAVVHSTDERP